MFRNIEPGLHPDCPGSRREFLWQFGAGFGGLALTSLLDRDGFFTRHGFAAETPRDTISPLSSRVPHFAPKAKHVIFLFMYGGPPSMDTWDYKPELQKHGGQEIDIETRRRKVTRGKLFASPRKFQQYGQAGLWGSDAFPHLNQRLDELCFVKSLYADTFAHGSGMIQMNTGQVTQGYPALGSWVGYGLGSENENLPAFVVMVDPRGGPIAGAANWSNGFMPAAYQGTHLRSKGEPILDLAPKGKTTRRAERDLIDTLAELNRQHMQERPGYSELGARIASYELAFQLQTAAPEALDLSQETARTLDLYGITGHKAKHALSLGPEPFGRQCLIARRLVERGVRFIQIYSGGGHSNGNWDAHGDVDNNLNIHAPEVDRPIYGLLTDLKERGLLDETLIVWGGEFGRQAVSQGSVGRDHNPLGFLYWLAGGGVKAGFSHGETDPLGHEAAVDRHHIRDLHATILHLMGLDHEKLTYFYGGLEHKLTGVQEANVIHDVIA